MSRYGLEGQVALVTGAAVGIGRGVALRLAREGVSVAVVDRDGPGAEAVAAEIRSLGQAAIGVRADVANGDEIDEMVGKTVRGFGRVDILVNNAGILVITPFLELDRATFEQHLAVNTTAVLLASQAVAKEMIRQGGGGRIITIVSVAGRVPSGRDLPIAAYVASKHATVGLVRQMAVELVEHGILANCVMPGTVDTPMQGRILTALAARHKESFEDARSRAIAGLPIGRLETPDDVASLVAFLASDDAGYSVGQCFDASGGGWFY